jgi:hypothetical protein
MNNINTTNPLLFQQPQRNLPAKRPRPDVNDDNQPQNKIPKTEDNHISSNLHDSNTPHAYTQRNPYEPPFDPRGKSNRSVYKSNFQPSVV